MCIAHKKRSYKFRILKANEVGDEEAKKRETQIIAFLNSTADA